MSTSKDFIQYILAQMERAGYLRTRQMFGEFSIYRHDKVIGWAADNSLLIKDTPEGRDILTKRGIELQFAELFPGATPSLRIDDVDDEDLLVALAIETDRVLPPPAPKKPRSRSKK